jgi:flagellar motor switch/type III secretory pathway protein FliN
LTADVPRLLSWSHDEPATAQVWHSDDGDAIDLWCVLTANEARSLLKLVLQGPAGDEPTPLEQNIVRDTIERLLAATGRVWEERSSAQLPPSDGWCCRLTLTDALGATATFTLLAPSSSSREASAERVDLRLIPVVVEAILPSIEMQVDAIARWRDGGLVALACAAESRVRLRIGSVCVASGSLGATRGRRAILISSQL